MTGLTAPLASSVGKSSVIKNLTVDVNFGQSQTVAVLRGVSGQISNVTAMGGASVFVEFNGGTADGVSVLSESNNSFTYAVSGTWSSLNRVRSYANYFYQSVEGSEKTLTVRNCYQDNGEWGKTGLGDVGCSDGFSADVDKVESLITSTNAGYSIRTRFQQKRHDRGHLRRQRLHSICRFLCRSDKRSEACHPKRVDRFRTERRP